MGSYEYGFAGFDGSEWTAAASFYQRDDCRRASFWSRADFSLRLE